MINNKIKVLIVDDQPLVLDLLSRGLSRDPKLDIVGTATDGYLALNMINRVNPQVIILDMEMPRMNGLQFLHNLMPVRPIPTIILSALTFKDSKLTDDALAAGAIDFLSKPSAGARGLEVLLNQLSTKIRIAVNKDVSYLKRPQKDYRLPVKTLDRTTKSDKIVLGMGEMDIASSEGVQLKIFALGSCISLALFSPVAVGLCHVALPNSKTDIEKSISIPGYFADTAVPAMKAQLLNKGANPSQIFAKIAGGAKTRVEIGDYFGIGQKNTIAVKAQLIKAGIRLVAEETGGEISRTAYVKYGDKMLSLHHPVKGAWEI